MTHSSSSTSRSARPELDFVELRRAREFRDRLASGVGRRSVPRPWPPTARPAHLRSLLFLIALLFLGYYAYASGERVWTDYRSSAWLESQTRSGQTSSDPPKPVHTEPEPRTGAIASAAAPAQPPKRLANGEPVGRLEIQALGVEGAVEHGNSSGVLRRAIGHLPGTALPGEGGHVVLAGHRDSFFRGLRRATHGQEITLSTPAGDFVYRIDGLSIVGPRDIEVIAPTNEERLTLVTCYPFDFVGPAPRRFIVTASPVSRPRASTLPSTNF